MPYPRSIRGRSAMAASLLALMVLLVLCATASAAIHYGVQDRGLDRAQQVAGQWSAAARGFALPRVLPASGEIDLVQEVDARGVVLAASRAAWGRPPLSAVRPAADDRIKRLTDGRYLVAAIRITPAPDAPVIYAGREVPFLLRGHRLEYLLGEVAIGLVAVVGWTAWTAVGQTLRPVEAIRARMEEITVTDLSLRVPVPPGGDEIAQLVRTANQTLERLDEAVAQQRRFASTTSHELRTPIAALRVQLEDALDDPGADPRQALRGALVATERLEAIVEDLLVLARLRADDPAPHELIDLGELARHEAGGPGAVPVTVRAEPGVWVSGSRIQLIRILANLVGNARRHAESAVEIRVTSEDGRAVLAVTDDGPGIAPRDRERVFERFTRLEDGRRLDPGGSGLGLAISRDIAHGHQGTLTVEDSPRGARFVLRLPRLDPAPDAAPAADERRALRPACG
ncbi:signal transduction histidine kinase [Thermocatellispora tengchongensis]|uniref:histidine kinase n=1 Tax=Thermocatellispora tengchongensis TaxID=1073253 RepID=A0A840P1T4_9ACTN|nr:HAMP domain-containing sensor histidine kinase [Thermocatellispora tengchongensis]MBB5133322.1 signal transduction histidine kinase [Thermocatellispora tengchongensis]